LQANNLVLRYPETHQGAVAATPLPVRARLGCVPAIVAVLWLELLDLRTCIGE